MNPPCGEGIHSITLVCLGVNFNPKMARSKRKAFPRVLALFPKMNLGLANARWRKFFGYLKRDFEGVKNHFKRMVTHFDRQDKKSKNSQRLLAEL